MSITALLLTGMMIGAPPGEPVPVPRWEKGQEITWRGTFSEAILRPNVRAFRNYETETRLLVLDVGKHGTDFALFTSIKLKPDVPTGTDAPPMVRIESLHQDADGRLQPYALGQMYLHPAKRSAFLPLAPMSIEGLPLLDTGVLLAIPGESMQFGQTWKALENSRPPISYQLAGTDSLRGSRCLKFTALQQSEDWDKPRPGPNAWRRGETILVSPKQGQVVKLDRTIEKQDPQTGELGFRSKLQYEQTAVVRYPERLGDDRRLEAIAAADFQRLFETAVNDPARTDSKPFEELHQRIDQHLVQHFNGESTPYRQATLAIKRKNDAARQGHIAPALPPADASSAILVPGKKAPDVPTLNLATRETKRLSELTDRPVLLLYYQPDSVRTAEPLLRFAEALHNDMGTVARILPVAVGTNEAACRQRDEFKLTVPILAGRSMYKEHGIDSTPCFVLLDKGGIVLDVTLGWSDENAEAVAAGLAKRVK